MDYLSEFVGYLHATENLSGKTLSAYTSDLRQFRGDCTNTSGRT